VTTIDRGTVTVTEMARVEETAQGEATPTIQIMRILVATIMEVKEVARPTTTTITTPITTTTEIVKEEITTIQTTIETTTITIWLADIGMPNWNQE
jgi:hypothetical protein